jgi:hypothetical protein
LQTLIKGVGRDAADKYEIKIAKNPRMPSDRKVVLRAQASDKEAELVIAFR